MRRLLWLIILSIWVFQAVSCSDEEETTEPVIEEPEITFQWLSTSGNRIVDESGEPVLLYGVNRSGLEYNKLGNGMTSSEFDYICNDWKAKVVRIPFQQEWIEQDEEYTDRLNTVIGWIKGYGSYVVLDLQWKNSEVKIPPIPDSSAVEMWRTLAEKYKDDPAVLYDIHNETHDTTFSAWRSRAVEIIDGIRSVHPKSLILVSGMNWASDISEWATDPLLYENVVYSVHAYPGWGGSDAWDLKFGNFSGELPIIVSEFGGYEENLYWGSTLIGYLKKKEIGWMSWSWVDDPYLTLSDRRTPTAFGSLVREALLRFDSPEDYANFITDVSVDFMTADRATINWNTTNKSDSKLLWGLTESYTDSIYAPAVLFSHSMKLSGLEVSTTYHFKAISVDEFGFAAESGDTTFSTPAE